MSTQHANDNGNDNNARNDDGDYITRFDFQQMMQEIAAENVRPVIKNVKQEDISQLFKRKKSSGADDKQ